MRRGMVAAGWEVVNFVLSDIEQVHTFYAEASAAILRVVRDERPGWVAVRRLWG
jgi:hypothetical protein